MIYVADGLLNDSLAWQYRLIMLLQEVHSMLNILMIILEDGE
jgi:hypothetical protein